MNQQKIDKVLFVCLGNICRSPSAEAVFVKMAVDRGLNIEVDSAGITGYHAGEAADSRMQTHASKREYNLTSNSRQVVVDDFYHYDIIIGMDASNISALELLAPSENTRMKITLMTDFCTRFNDASVPDPYYGGAAGFELVLDILEDACEGLLDRLQ